MADDKKSKNKAQVQLTPGKPAEPKLATVTPGPKTVKVTVPKAAPVTQVKAPEDTAPATVAVNEGNPDLIKKGVLLDEVVAATGVKRADAKSVMEALFAVMGDHLRAEKAMQLPPLGKVKVIKAKPVGQGATALTLRIRTPNIE